MRHLTIVILFIVLLVGCTGTATADTTNYAKWIGPTMPAHNNTSYIAVDNTGYNMTLNSMFGTDIGNSTLSSFDLGGVLGGLTWAFHTIGPWLILLMGIVIAVTIYMGNGQSTIMPGFVMIGCGILGGVNMIAFMMPIEWLIGAGFVIVLGLAALVYGVVMGRG